MSEAVRLVSGLQHPGSAGSVYESTQHFTDIKEHLHMVKRDIDSLVQRNMVTWPPLPLVVVSLGSQLLLSCTESIFFRAFPVSWFPSLSD